MQCCTVWCDSGTGACRCSSALLTGCLLGASLCLGSEKQTALERTTETLGWEQLTVHTGCSRPMCEHCQNPDPPTKTKTQTSKSRLTGRRDELTISTCVYCHCVCVFFSVRHVLFCSHWCILRTIHHYILYDLVNDYNDHYKLRNMSILCMNSAVQTLLSVPFKVIIQNCEAEESFIEV